MYKEDFQRELGGFLKKVTSSLREVRLSRLADGIAHEMVVPKATYAPWRDDAAFLETYETVRGNTLVDIYRCYELWYLLRRNRHLSGDVLEVGVWRGGTGCLMGRALAGVAGCTVNLVDTFEGVVKASNLDTIYSGGEHSDTSEQVVADLADSMGLRNVKIVRGVFPDDAATHDLLSKEFRLCHIDVDTYISAKEILRSVWPNVVVGGMVVFDDYGFWGCEGVTRLCNELELEGGIFLHNLNGHQVIVRVGDRI